MKSLFKVLAVIVISVFLIAELCPKAFAWGMWPPRKKPKVTEPYYKALEEAIPTEEELREQEKKRLIEEVPKSKIIEELEKKKRIGDVDVTP